MKRAQKTLFVTWHPECRRSDQIAAAMDGVSELIHVGTFKDPKTAPLRYIAQTWLTIAAIRRVRPSVIFVATPPVVSVVVVAGVARALRVPFIVDAHTGAFDDRRWAWAQPLQEWLNRRAAAVIVTGDNLSRQVSLAGATPVLLSNIPLDDADTWDGNVNRSQIFCVNTFSADEPLQEILGAAESLPMLTFIVSGDEGSARSAIPTTIPANVRLTGWLENDEYRSLLASSAVVLSMTTRDETFQQGGNEAMWAGRPLVTSDFPVLRQIFHTGAIHVTPTAAGIAQGVADAVERQNELSSAIQALNEEARSAMDHLRALVHDLA